MIDWSDANTAWGAPETCVHESSTASWLTDRHGEEAVQS